MGNIHMVISNIITGGIVGRTVKDSTTMHKVVRMVGHMFMGHSFITGHIVVDIAKGSITNGGGIGCIEVSSLPDNILADDNRITTGIFIDIHSHRLPSNFRHQLMRAEFQMM